MKKLFLLIIVSVFSSLPLYADDARTFMLQIKKNTPEYIYGEATGENFNEARDNAFNNLQIRVNEFLNNLPDSLKNDCSDEKLRSLAQMTGYQRTEQINVVLCYVKKELLVKSKCIISDEQKYISDDSQSRIYDSTDRDRIDASDTINIFPKTIDLEDSSRQYQEGHRQTLEETPSLITKSNETLNVILSINNYDELKALKQEIFREVFSGIYHGTEYFCECMRLKYTCIQTRSDLMSKVFCL